MEKQVHKMIFLNSCIRTNTPLSKTLNLTKNQLTANENSTNIKHQMWIKDFTRDNFSLSHHIRVIPGDTARRRLVMFCYIC